jgi:hypothetical protein
MSTEPEAVQKYKGSRQNNLGAGDDRIQIDPLVTLMVVAR